LQYEPKEDAMAKKILIAMDDSQNAFRAVELVAQSFSTDNTIVLFSVLMDTAALCKMNSPELSPIFRSQQSNFCALEDKKKELVTDAVHRAKDLLMSYGWAGDLIETKIESKNKGIASDILTEAGNNYQMIVLGRRGVSGLKEFFLGSTTNKVFSGAKNISVLIAS
jgi:nucleotide-binding universal stress UspA family protein